MSRSQTVIRVGWVGLLCVILALATGAPAAAGKLDRDLERLMRKAKVPGLATAIVVGDEIVQRGAYGWADPETGTPVTPDTVFFLASATKPITATIAMRLVDRKRLDLDTDVNHYLDFEVVNPYFPDQPITLRHLLTHTSSISDKGFGDQIDEIASDGDWPGTLTQFLIDYLTPGGRLYSAETSYWAEPPGTRPSYSNVGFALINALIEAGADDSLEAASHDLLFEPLGMDETSWSLAHLDLDNVAAPCTWTDDGFVAYPHQGLAIGVLRTSAVQFADFARLHLNQGRFEGRRILKKKTARKMVRVQVPWENFDGDYGFGFYVRREQGNDVAHHRGGFTGSATWVWLDLDQKIAVVLLMNGEPFFESGGAVRFYFKVKDRLVKQARRMARRGAG